MKTEIRSARWAAVIDPLIRNNGAVGSDCAVSICNPKTMGYAHGSEKAEADE